MAASLPSPLTNHLFQNTIWSNFFLQQVQIVAGASISKNIGISYIYPQFYFAWRTFYFHCSFKLRIYTNIKKYIFLYYYIFRFKKKLSYFSLQMLMNPTVSPKQAQSLEDNKNVFFPTRKLEAMIGSL